MSEALVAAAAAAADRVHARDGRKKNSQPAGEKTGPSSKKLKSFLKWSHRGIVFKGKSERSRK